MRSEIAERLALENKLRSAIDAQQFEIHYQPQVSIATGRIEAVEALLRWNDPELGLIPPPGFLDLLEASGMIVRVGHWVLTRAVEDCRRWQAQGLGPLRVAVNVSPLQLRRRAFVEYVLERSRGWTRAGYGLDLEITETAVLQDLEGAGRKLRELREAGVRIALDDFGTGYSSLGLLSRLEVDVLKIDRSFVAGLPADQASLTLVGSIIQLATAFNLITVGEGVENVEQLELLRQLGCRQSQGHLHFRPMRAPDLEEVLRRQRTAAGT
jgi:EAL domain-containing protein (putative c-di-GMP-specific phosphodiesterase class I)